jgi:hypothetical protein
MNLVREWMPMEIVIVMVYEVWCVVQGARVEGSHSGRLSLVVGGKPGLTSEDV